MELLCQPGSTVRGEEDVSPLLPAGLIHTDHDHSPITEGTAGSPDIKGIVSLSPTAVYKLLDSETL